MSKEKTDWKRLKEALARKDPAAMEELCRLSADICARALVGPQPQDTAHDVLHKMLRTLFLDRRSALRVLDIRNLEAYIRRCLSNILRDKASKLKLRPDYPALPPDLIPEESGIVGSDLDNPSNRLMQREMRAMIFESLAELSGMTRNIIVMRFVTQLPVSEIVVRTGLTRQAVEGRLKRGRQRLQALLRARGLYPPTLRDRSSSA